jgi:hypothetical protein
MGGPTRLRSGVRATAERRRSEEFAFGVEDREDDAVVDVIVDVVLSSS